MYIKIVIVLILSGVFFIVNTSFISTDTEIVTKEKIYEPVDPPFSNVGENWVDSVFNSLSADERIAQMFMVAAYSNMTKSHVDKISKLVKDDKIGGLIFMQGGPVRHSNLINYYQSIANTPLLISMDAEWGVSMRLDSTIRFPRQMMLGAIQDDNLIFQMGEQIAYECQQLGIHVDFAPVIDVNNNPDNPVIGSRSFGEDKYNVARKGIAYMKGLQAHNVLATGKHFPGHGDTNVDSHKDLPIINHSFERLDTLELYPFKELINEQLGGMMVAHLYIPSLDTTPHLATTLSKNVVNDLLKDSLNFKGLIFTDALGMKGVSKYFEPGIVDVKALLAGNDVLLFSEDVPTAVIQIKQAIARNEISMSEIDKRVRKILQVKYWTGLYKFKPIDTSNLIKDLNSPKAELLKRKLIENALTLVKDDDNIIPLNGLDTLKIASVVVGNKTDNSFQRSLSLYANVTKFSITKEPTDNDINKLIDDLKDFNLVIVGVHDTNRKPYKNFGITDKTVTFVNSLSDKNNVVLDVFGNPYSLKLFDIDKCKAVLVSYNDEAITNEISAQAIFGGVPFLGKLPVSISEEYKVGHGIAQKKKIRLKYSIPEEVGIDRLKLDEIDSIALNAIRKGATPGCQILVAKDGAVIYNKSFGYHTYNNLQAVENTDLYDLASITKISASIPSLMHLYETEEIKLSDNISKHLSYLDTTNKGGMIIKEILTHQARLTPWIPFYLRSIKEDSLRIKIYCDTLSRFCTIKVAEDLYIDPHYRDTIYKDIIESKLLPKKKYRYSDLGYYLLQEVIEKYVKDSLQNYVSDNFYKPLGAYTLGYRPLERFSIIDIIPTENDELFRKQLIDGYVHDPGAAMLGGVAGHAGLFSNANDLAKLMQMYLQNGEYGGVRYFNPETIKLFTSSPYLPKNRRAIGFDKPEADKRVKGPTCDEASPESYGHSGFTGTYTWVDPKSNLVYIFLSNRIYPTAENKKLITMNTRTKIHKIIYDAIEVGK